MVEAKCTETADTQLQTALNSFHTIACDNKEIKRDFVEEFVIEQLHQYPLGDKLIPELTAQLNQYIKASETTSQEIFNYKQRINELENNRKNIIEPITITGFNDNL